MTIIKELDDYLPSTIDIYDTIHKAIFGDVDKYPDYTLNSKDQKVYQVGAIANELERLQDYLDQITTTLDVADFTGRYLEILAELFVGFYREFNESDASLQTKMEAILRRGKVPTTDETEFDSWDTEFCILNVLGYFLPRENLFVEPIIEGGAANTLFTAYNFNGDTSDWIYKVNGATTTLVTTTSDPFMDGFSAVLEADAGGSSLAQTFSVSAAGTYFFGGYFRDLNYATASYEVFISVQRASDSYYYNESTLAWQASFVENRKLITQANWSYLESFCELTGADDLTVTFHNPGGEELQFDRALASERLSYPNIRVVARASTVGAKVFWGLQDSSDPVSGVDYANNVAYLDNSYLSVSIGSITLYSDLVEAVKMSGCRVELSLIVSQ